MHYRDFHHGETGRLKGRTEETFARMLLSPVRICSYLCVFGHHTKHRGTVILRISGHWAEAEIERAATLGWICGYEDGTFRPENRLPAPAMAMINRVLCRLP